MNNIISLFLGILAWTLPVVYLMRWKYRTQYCCGSFGLCAASLWFQLREISRRTALGDFAAIEDTIGAVIFAATMLIAVTAALNALAMLRRER